MGWRSLMSAASPFRRSDLAHVLIAEARFYAHLNDMLLDGVRSAGRMIERAGRAPAEGRVSVPAEYLRQIASDGTMLSEVARALSQGDAAAAGRTLGEILSAWRDLTGAK